MSATQTSNRESGRGFGTAVRVRVGVSFSFSFFFSSFTVKASWVGERVLYDRDGAALQT